MCAIDKLIASAKEKNKKVFIRGMGYFGQMLGMALDYRGISFDGYIDSDPAKHGTVIFKDHMCYAPSCADSQCYALVAIASEKAKQAIVEELTAAGTEYDVVFEEDIVDLSMVIDDETYLRNIFELRNGYTPDFKDPRSFNEKLQWLKMNYRIREHTELADKFAVRKHITEKIGSEYLVPLIGHWTNFDEIDFSLLPEQFVLKCSHDSGSTIICHNKEMFDIDNARSVIERFMRRNYYWHGREWCYKDIEPMIMAERLLSPSSGESINDYKFMCFNGKVKCSFVCSERNSPDGLKVTFFDNDWNVMPFKRHYPISKVDIPKPESYDAMVSLAEKLSEGIPFVRVDFYDVCGKIYFGEMTFYPGNGFEEFTPRDYDYILGSWIDLPEPQR